MKHTRVVGGRLNVSRKLNDGNLTVTGLASTGVARISLGPQLQFIAMQALTDQRYTVPLLGRHVASHHSFELELDIIFIIQYMPQVSAIFRCGEDNV